MEAILLVDVEPERADLICEMLAANDIEVKRCHSIDETRKTVNSVNCPAVIVVHCELVNRAFTELARLRHHPKVKLIFYCTDNAEKSVPKLPEELQQIILKITESKRSLQHA